MVPVSDASTFEVIALEVGAAEGESLLVLLGVEEQPASAMAASTPAAPIVVMRLSFTM